MAQTVKIDGMGELRRALAQLPDRVEEIAREVVAESSEAVRANTANRVARDTGQLAADVEIRTAGDGLSADVGWFDGRDYYAQYPEAGTSRQSAQPSLAPSVEEERARIVDRTVDAVRRRLT